MAESIGDRLKLFRAERGLTLAQVAEVAQVGLNAVHKWETNQASPRAESIAALFDPLGADLESLMIGGPPGQARRFDWELLWLIESTLDRWADQRGVTLLPARRRQVIPLIYRHMIEFRDGQQRETKVLALLDLVAA